MTTGRWRERCRHEPGGDFTDRGHRPALRRASGCGRPGGLVAERWRSPRMRPTTSPSSYRTSADPSPLAYSTGSRSSLTAASGCTPLPNFVVIVTRAVCRLAVAQTGEPQYSLRGPVKPWRSHGLRDGAGACGKLRLRWAALLPKPTMRALHEDQQDQQRRHQHRDSSPQRDQGDHVFSSGEVGAGGSSGINHPRNPDIPPASRRAT